MHLGPEYDKRTRAALRAVLKELGAVSSESDWGVGGSQEIETVVFSVRGHKVTVEAETFIGLTVTGEESLVGEIAELVTKRLGK